MYKIQRKEVKEIVFKKKRKPGKSLKKKAKGNQKVLYKVLKNTRNEKQLYEVYKPANSKAKNEVQEEHREEDQERSDE